MKQFILLTICCSFFSCAQSKKNEKENENKDSIAQHSSKSCGTGGAISNAIEKVEFDGSWYWLGVPETKGRTLPLVVVLHGDEGNPNNMKRFWEGLWETKQDFILLAPECPKGICDKGGVNTWSAGGYDGSEPQGIWLKNTIAKVAKEYPVDVSRIYAAGYSGGAIFLGYQGFKMFQDVFAGIQWFCGGVNETEEQVYRAPKDLNCKVPGRLVISKSGDVSYLITAAERISEILKKNGHRSDYLDTKCDGHCCDAHLYTEDAYDWFVALSPKCGKVLGDKCYKIDDVPISN